MQNSYLHGRRSCALQVDTGAVLVVVTGGGGGWGGGGGGGGGCIVVMVTWVLEPLGVVTVWVHGFCSYDNMHRLGSLG